MASTSEWPCSVSVELRFLLTSCLPVPGASASPSKPPSGSKAAHPSGGGLQLDDLAGSRHSSERPATAVATETREFEWGRDVPQDNKKFEWSQDVPEERKKFVWGTDIPAGDCFSSSFGSETCQSLSSTMAAKLRCLSHL